MLLRDVIFYNHHESINYIKYVYVEYTRILLYLVISWGRSYLWWALFACMKNSFSNKYKYLIVLILLISLYFETRNMVAVVGWFGYVAYVETVSVSSQFSIVRSSNNRGSWVCYSSTNIATVASTSTKVNMKTLPFKLKENPIENWKLFKQRWDAYKVLSNYDDLALY